MTLESAGSSGEGLPDASRQTIVEHPGPVALPRTANPEHLAGIPEADLPCCSEREHWLRRLHLERQLHDGAALRISALTLQIGLFRHQIPDADPVVHASIDGMQEELHAVLEELRDVASKIYPPLLDQTGLGPALREVADRIEAPVRIDALEDRFSPAAEGTAYYAVSKCLDALDPDAPPVEVVVRRDAHMLVIELTGIDLRHAEPMLDQVRDLGCTIKLAGGPGVGTITARIPCE